MWELVLFQVISLDVRTNLSEGLGVIPRSVPDKPSTPDTRSSTPSQDNQNTPETEIRFVYILNRVLPPEIRVLAWSPVPTCFSARFSCTSRTYKYFFPRGDLDLELMRAGLEQIVGEHDFRNLCKMDVGNGVVNFTRSISRVDLKTISSSAALEPVEVIIMVLH